MTKEQALNWIEENQGSISIIYNEVDKWVIEDIIENAVKAPDLLTAIEMMMVKRGEICQK